MRFVSYSEASEKFIGKTVAIVGSAPSCAENEPGFVDSHDVVVRVNNYRTGDRQGHRCDVFYSFFGGSIKKSIADLKADGVTLCMCKCPNSRPIESEWHSRAPGRVNGIDFRYIYRMRADWWFCDTWIPSTDHFRRSFQLLDRHIPTTGFAAVLDVLAMRPRSVYLTGFDFFSSGLHNVNEKWRPGDPHDPIGHVPEREAKWIATNLGSYPIALDATLERLLAKYEAAAV
jgi:hypothetical protein